MSASASSSGAQDKSGTMPTPPKATEYRNPTVEDDDDDDEDLDDLDDVLDSFNAPPKSALGKRDAPDAGSAAVATPGAAGPSASGPSVPAGAGGEVVDDEFEASLIEGMESLLRSLAAENPPGPMADGKGPFGAAATGDAGGKAREGAAGAAGMSSDEEEKAFQRAVQMMLSGEGLEAMGLDGKGKPSASGAGAAASSSSGPARTATPGKEQLNFEDTIKRTMESLNAGGAGAGSARDEMPGDIAALLKQLSEDPSALDGLGDDDDELGGLLDGMMSQLMSKEVLEEPMGELAAKYPGYLEKPPAGVSKADLEKYRKQHELVKQILDVFKRPGYTDDKDGKEVAKLVGEMQDLGGPPNEIMGDLPEGFDLGALGGEEGCVVM